MRSRFAFLLSLSFAALAVLVSTGACTGLDQWAEFHAPPELERSGAGTESDR